MQFYRNVTWKDSSVTTLSFVTNCNNKSQVYWAVIACLCGYLSPPAILRWIQSVLNVRERALEPLVIFKYIQAVLAWKIAYGKGKPPKKSNAVSMQNNLNSDRWLLQRLTKWTRCTGTPVNSASCLPGRGRDYCQVSLLRWISTIPEFLQQQSAAWARVWVTSNQHKLCCHRASTI